jgi:PAS domain S-box-containing protein
MNTLSGSVRKRAEHMASENPDAIVSVLDCDGRLIDTSPASELLLGYRHSERIGRPSLKFICPADADHAALAFQDALLNGESVVFGFKFLTKAGAQLPVRCILYSLQDPASGELFVLAKSVPDGRP